MDRLLFCGVDVVWGWVVLCFCMVLMLLNMCVSLVWCLVFRFWVCLILCLRLVSSGLLVLKVLWLIFCISVCVSRLCMMVSVLVCEGL